MEPYYQFKETIEIFLVLLCFSKFNLHLLFLFHKKYYLSYIKYPGFKELQHCRNHIECIPMVKLSVGIFKVYSVCSAYFYRLLLSAASKFLVNFGE